MEVPFQYGRIAEADSFIDRIDDRRELKNFLSHGINTILVSPRRWGKSSLVKESMKELLEEDKSIRVCFLDAYKIHTEEEFYNKFASAIIQGVSSTLEPETILQLPEKIAIEKGIRVIVCIDEYEEQKNACRKRFGRENQRYILFRGPTV